MKIRLVFDDWRMHGTSVYNSETGIELSMGDFHSGTTFDGTIELDDSDEEELNRAIKAGYQPAFYLIAE